MCLAEKAHNLLCIFHIHVLVYGAGYLEIRETLLFGCPEKFERHFLACIIALERPVCGHDILQLVKEPIVYLGESMDLVDSISCKHCLGNHKDTPVCRFAQSLVHISDLKLLVADESVCSLPYHPETFLDCLFE